MVKDTLLTSPLTPEQELALKEQEQLWDRAHVIALNIWLEGFKSGDIGFEKMSNEVHKALTKIALPERHKQRLLGILVNEALLLPKPQRTRGSGKVYPTSLKKIASSLVDQISLNEGLAKSRYSPNESAFEKASQVLADCGFKVSTNTLINWYSEFRNQ